MRKMTMRGVLAFGTVVVVSTGAALAQDGAMLLTADQVVATRKAGMNLQAGNLIAMKQAVEAGTDVKPLVGSAKSLAGWGRVIPTVFPAGTEAAGATKARPEIWSDRAGFERAAANLVTQADKLMQLADANDKPGFAAQYTATTQACGGCHRNFQVR